MEPDVPPVVAKVVRKGEKNAMIHFSMGAPAWSPDYEMASKLPVGKPLPSDWRVEQGEYGPKALPPKQGKGGGGYRMTKEAFDREAESRREWQLVEEDRRDRRTALMQAVEFLKAETQFGGGNAIVVAEQFYDWLKDHETSAPARHEHTTGEKPGDRGSGADIGGGGAQDPLTAPAPSTYPVDPAVCTHKTASGAWVKWAMIPPDFQDRCPKCGTPKLVAMEGTTEDLGPA